MLSGRETTVRKLGPPCANSWAMIRPPDGETGEGRASITAALNLPSTPR
ncbi:hypothetical protein ACRAWD_04440 [Caulobacter segnis]